MSYQPNNPNGQATMANSSPVVVASNQSNIPIALKSLSYPASTGNNTTAQLTASSTFTGTIEDILNQQAAQIQVTCDQPFTLTIYQYIDLAGTKLISTDVFTRLANVGLNENVTLPGNYFKITLQNTGASSTTNLRLDVTFGIMDTLPRTLSNNGNLKIALNEIGGTTFAASTSFGDAKSNSQVALPAEAYLMGFNGTTWDRIRLDAQQILRTRSHRDLVRISVGVTSVTTATTAYTAGDQVGGLISLASAARGTGGTGTIVSIQLIDASDIIGAYDVVFHRASTTLAGDNAVYAISDADALNVVGLAQLAGAFDIGNNRIAQAYNLAIPYDCSGGTTLYASLITRVGHTFFTAGSLPTLVVWVEYN